MTSLIGSSSRSVVPRWRQSSTFGSSPEASPISTRNVVVTMDDWADISYFDWQKHRTAGYLADAFSAAIYEGRQEYKNELAKCVLQFGDKVPRYLQSLAADIVSDSSGDVSQAPNVKDFGNFDREILSQVVRRLKNKILFSNRNAFLWHDLGLTYTLLGEKEKAEKAMLASLKLSGSHRLIARSAARFFLHEGQSDRAKDTLIRADGFNKDPWLLAAHVATSQSAGEQSRYLRKAKSIFDNFDKGRIVSELGMALATEELMYGKSKIAKFLVRESKVGATENAIAQGVWLSERLNISLFERKDEIEQLAFEAIARDAYYKSDWDSSLKNAVCWLRDQPFSSNAALFSSFVASTFKQDFVFAEKIVRLGLQSSPSNWMLKNNLVVSLAEQDKIASAELEFGAIPIPDKKAVEFPTWLATNGLLKYRSGDLVGGRSFYAKSYDLLKERKDTPLQVVAAIYQSTEEARLGHTVNASNIIRKVQMDVGKGDRNTSKLIDLLAIEIRGAYEKRVIENKKNGVRDNS